MTPKLTSAKLKILCALLVYTAVGLDLATAADTDLKVVALLLWGTNEAKSPDPKHKPVDAEVKEKLQELPLKWSHYFEVNRKAMTVPVMGAKKELLSERCALEVKNLGRSKVDVSLFGKGEQVVKRTQELPKGETLVLGGNAPNSTAWLVFIKRVE